MTDSFKKAFLTILPVWLLSATIPTTTGVQASEPPLKDNRASTSSPLSGRVAASTSSSSTSADNPCAGPNVFTPPEQGRGQVPTFSEPREGGHKIRKMLMGAQGDSIPGFQQIKMIPSLNKRQRAQIRQIYAGAKDEAKPLLDEIKAMRGKFADDKQKAMQDPQIRERIKALKQQLLSRREQTWSQVKALLSPGQLGELTAMKRGELVPGTFHGASVGSADTFAGRRDNVPASGDMFKQGSINQAN